MNDLTKGPVGGHIRQLSAFIALTTLFQTLYFLADLYFVGRLGKEAIAGVGLAGNLTMLVLALTQSLGVGTTSLLSRAIGRKDVPEAERVLNQSLVLSSLAGIAFCVVAFSLREAYCRWLAADPATARLGVAYLDWYIPAMALQFPLVALAAALRGLGDMKVPTLIQIATVLINIALAPVLIFGWGGGVPSGSRGRPSPPASRSLSAGSRSLSTSAGRRARCACAPRSGGRSPRSGAGYSRSGCPRAASSFS